jgi:hypothetical protein
LHLLIFFLYEKYLQQKENTGEKWKTALIDATQHQSTHSRSPAGIACN